MSNKYERFDDDSSNPPFLLSIRFLLSILIFFGITIQYAHKADISVAILAMVNHTALNEYKNDTSQLNNYEKLSTPVGAKPCLFANSSSHRDPDGPFVWSKGIQEFILASYFYGYLLSQIPGGYLSFKFGPKIVFLLSMFLGSLGTILVPVCAQWHYMALIFCRFLTGIAQGVMWPTMMGMWSKWAPKNEKSLLISIGTSGSQIGQIIGFSLGGYLCAHGFAGGWPSVFYYFGIGGLLWCVLWAFMTSNTPAEHKFIKENEKNYIINETSAFDNNNNTEKTPWKSIITSKACLAVFVAHFCQCWGVVLFLTNAPTYMKEVLKFDIKSNGLLLSIPFIATQLTITLCGFISDKLIKNLHFDRCKVRKFFTGVGLTSSAAFMIGLAYVGCDTPYNGVILLTFGLALSGFINGGGFLVSYNEIAGSYAGILFGVSNTFASTTGIFVPYLIQAVTPNQTQDEWKIVFFVTAGVFFIGAVVYTIFGSAKLEPWASKKNTIEFTEGNINE